MKRGRPRHIGVVDTGSTAIRVVVAQVHGPEHFVVLHKERWPICLGDDVFAGGVLSPSTTEATVDAFSHFAALFRRHQVVTHRAVATSALRRADNGQALIDEIAAGTSIQLEVISGVEEAALTSDAICHALGSPQGLEVVLDIGGGSLEFLWFDEDARVSDVVSLPLGTVRMRRTLGLEGVLDNDDIEALRRRVIDTLSEHGIEKRKKIKGFAVGAGGNVDDLAEVFEGKKVRGVPSLDIVKMSQNLEWVTALTVRERMARFGVRRDRAELMAIAAVVLATAGKWLGIKRLGAPDVGVREGLVARLCREIAPDDSGKKALPNTSALQRCRYFARRFNCDEIHVEQVRKLAVTIFDDLVDIHCLGPQERLALECAAVLHNIGNALEHGGRHKQSASLIEGSDLHGLEGRLADMVTVVVRHHRSAFPASRHSRFMDLDKEDRLVARKLAAMLRLAVGLDATQTQLVDDLEVQIVDGEARFYLAMETPSPLPAISAEQKCHLFELAFELRPRFVCVARSDR